MFVNNDQDDSSMAAKDPAVTRSVEGYIVFISNVHEEAEEDDIYDMFADFGELKQLQLNLDRRTGFVKVGRINQLPVCVVCVYMFI